MNQTTDQRKLIPVWFITYNTDVIKMERLERLERQDRLKNTTIDQRIRRHIDQRTQENEVERLREIMAENFPRIDERYDSSDSEKHNQTQER